MDLMRKKIITGGAIVLLPFLSAASQGAPRETMKGRFVAGAANYILMEDQGRETVVRLEKSTSLKGFGALRELEEGDSISVAYRKRANSVVVAETVEAAPVVHSDGSIMAALSSLAGPGGTGAGLPTVIDARSREDYDFAHIAGALPADGFDCPENSRDLPIIIYGENARDERPFSVLRHLVERGCGNAKVLQGGLSTYRTTKMPLESTPKGTVAGRFWLIVDVRDAPEFGKERVKGAENAPSGAQALLSFFSPEGTPDILVYGYEKDEPGAVTQARRIIAMKYDQDRAREGIVAYAKGGFEALKSSGFATESGEKRRSPARGRCHYNMPREVFNGEMALSAEKYLLLDVRAGSRPAEGNTISIPLEDLPEKALSMVPRGRKVIVFCEHGIRARIAARVLLDNGYEACFLEGLP